MSVNNCFRTCFFFLLRNLNELSMKYQLLYLSQVKKIDSNKKYICHSPKILNEFDMEQLT